MTSEQLPVAPSEREPSTPRGRRQVVRKPIVLSDLGADLALEHRIVQAAGKRFSIKLETSFWRGLQEAAAERQARLNHLVAAVAAQESPTANLASRLRVFCLAQLRARLTNATYAVSRTSLMSVIEAAPAACLILAANQTTLAVNRSFHAWFGRGADQIVGRPVLRDFRFKARRSLDDIWSGFYQGRMDEEPARMINFAPGRVLAANVTLSPVNLPGKARFACLVWLHK
jgi:predicted DNA-binding ribbon-helix-helix protein